MSFLHSIFQRNLMRNNYWWNISNLSSVFVFRKVKKKNVFTLFAKKQTINSLLKFIPWHESLLLSFQENFYSSHLLEIINNLQHFSMGHFIINKMNTNCSNQKLCREHFRTHLHIFAPSIEAVISKEEKWYTRFLKC